MYSTHNQSGSAIVTQQLAKLKELGVVPKVQAIDVMTGKPIASLYAAGEVTGGVHGAVRLGSCATLDCLIFGPIAGQNAAKEKIWS